MSDQAEIDRLQHELTSLQDQRSRTDLTGDQATELNQKISSVQSKLNLAKFGMLGTAQPSTQHSPSNTSPKVKTFSSKVGVLEGEEADPANPYQNWQNLHENKNLAAVSIAENPESKIYETKRDYAEEERIARSNMFAKEREINAPGNFTKEEAERIKQGLDPQKQAEIDAQVLPEQKDPKKPVNSLQLEISEKVTDLLNDQQIGRNEKRAQLKLLRQQIQSIEEQMDKNLI